MFRVRYILFFFFCWSFATQAQDLRLSFLLKNKNADNAYSFEEEKGDLTYVLQDHRKFQIEIFDRNLNKKNSAVFTVDAFSKKSTFLGIHARTSKVEVYYYDESKKEYAVLVYNKADSTYKYRSLEALGPEEEMLKGFSANGEFRILSTYKNNNTLVVRTIRDAEFIDKKEFDTQYASFHKKLKEETDYSEQEYSRVNIPQIEYSLGNDVFTAASTKKLYTIGNKIYISFDNFNVTTLLTVNLSDYTFTNNKYSFSLERCQVANNTYGNSFILEDKLFRMTLCHSQLNIAVIDLKNNELIKNLNQFLENPLTINNGAIIEERIESGNTTRKPVENTKKYIAKAMDSDLSIAANRVGDNTYQLYVGGYRLVVTGGTPGMSPGITPSIGIGMGSYGGFGTGVGVGIGSPGFGSPYGYGGGYSPYGAYNPFYNTSTTVRHTLTMRTLIDATDCYHVAGEAVKIPYHQIKDYLTKNFKNSPDLLNYGAYKGNAYLGYYSKKDGMYRVYEFKPRVVN